MTAFNAKWKYEKLAVQFDSSFAFAVILCCCFAEDSYEMFKGLLNTLVQPFFFSLSLLFGGAHSRGRYFGNFWVGMCRWDPGTLSLYQS